MHNPNKSFSITSLIINLVIFVSIILVSPTAAVDLPFDPNAYSFLVYVPNLNPNYDNITPAMEHILGRPLNQNEIRTSSDPVTPTDLATHDILIVGWNAYGNIGGLHSKDLLAGITGRIILTGHDLDFHTASPGEYWYREAAEKMLVQSINYVLTGSGTGLITLGDYLNTFTYLPEEWDISAQISDGEDINNFTSEALASGVYDNLDHQDMSDWNGTYHNKFTINSGSLFVPFELGGITIANCHYL